MEWNDQMDDLLKEGAEEGLSAALIAEKITATLKGQVVTRNAVLGRLFRQGIVKNLPTTVRSNGGRPRKVKYTSPRPRGRPTYAAHWEEKSEQLRDMKDMGMTFAEIGEAMNTSGQYIRLKMIELGIHIPFQQHYFTEDDIKYLCAAWNDSVSLEEIADHLDRSFGVIRQKILALQRKGIIKGRSARTTRVLNRYGRIIIKDGMTPDEAAEEYLRAQGVALQRALSEAHAAKTALKRNAINKMHEAIANGTDRDEAIFYCRASGATLQDIAAEIGVTRERVRQICNKYAQEMALKEYVEKKNVGNR